MFFRRGSRGFTLIELLVVIAIIAILAAILFPVLGTAKERGRQARCLSNLKELAMAFQSYCGDWNEGTPFAGWTRWTPMSSNWCGCTDVGSATFILNNAQLWPYGKGAGIYLCPSDAGRKGRYVQANCPLSYAINDDICSGDGRTAIRLSGLKCRKYSKVCLFIHEARGTAGSSSPIGLNDGIFCPRQYNSGQDFGEKIHYTGTTVAYVDGHARWAPFTALQEERCTYRYWDVDR